jgi:hypothetical protein
MSSYYSSLTHFINDRSGLDPLSVKQVIAVAKAVRAMEKPHDRRNLTTDLATGDTQCTARSKATGKRCKGNAMLGGNVCRVHGGAAPQTRAKAQRRLQQAADVLVQRLLQFALDGNVADNVAIVAIRDALDRAGLKPGIDVSVTAKAFESIFDQVQSGSRSDYRRSQGIEDDTPALEPPVEVEVLEDWLEPNVDDDAYHITPDDPVNRSPFDTAAHLPGTTLMTMEEATQRAAVLRHAHRR